MKYRFGDCCLVEDTEEAGDIDAIDDCLKFWRRGKEERCDRAEEDVVDAVSDGVRDRVFSDDGLICGFVLAFMSAAVCYGRGVVK